MADVPDALFTSPPSEPTLLETPWLTRPLLEPTLCAQATLAAVGFYEGVGFVRVGAVARYAPLDISPEALRTLPTIGYRHWADADELMAAEFGEASYLMALDLRTWHGGAPVTLANSEAYPEVTPMPKAKDLRRMTQCHVEGGHLAYESGDGVVVSLLPASGDGPPTSSEEIRMEVRYEVEAIVSHRGSGATLEYEVRWAQWPNTTWEPAANLVGANAALAAYRKKGGRKIG